MTNGDRVTCFCTDNIYWILPGDYFTGATAACKHCVNFDLNRHWNNTADSCSIYTGKRNMQVSLPIHEAIKPISWLIGRWVGQNGVGEYPSISPFVYCEEIEFSSMGQPLLNYTSRTWHAEKKNPMHFESGFLRIKPGTDEVAFMVSHNFGLSEIEEGKVKETTLVLDSKNIIRMGFAKSPVVNQIQRQYVLEGDVLSFTLSMATSNNPALTKHLMISYKKSL